MKFALCLLLYVAVFTAHAEEHTPKFERYAWLSEEQNNLAERWHKQNKKLYALLFLTLHLKERGVRMDDLSMKEMEHLEKWRLDDPQLFALLYGKAWPLAVEATTIKL